MGAWKARRTLHSPAALSAEVAGRDHRVLTRCAALARHEIPKPLRIRSTTESAISDCDDSGEPLVVVSVNTIARIRELSLLLVCRTTAIGPTTSCWGLFQAGRAATLNQFLASYATADLSSGLKVFFIPAEL